MSFRKKPGRNSEGSYSHCRVGKKCPVEVGDELEVNITDVSPSGDGMTRIQGYIINVPKAKPRERVKIKIINTGEKTANGKIVE